MPRPASALAAGVDPAAPPRAAAPVVPGEPGQPGVPGQAGQAHRTGQPAAALPPAAWSERSHELGHLLGRAGLGDRRAFAELYDKTSGYLFAVVLRIQRDRAVAEELLQEIYVTLWRNAAGFDAARAQPLTWLTHIARNRAIDSLRRAEAQPRSFASLGAAGGGGSSSEDGADDAWQRTVEALPDEAAGPFELLAQASDARELGRCMEHLSAAQRQSVALAFYDGLTHAEVAERLHQPLGTVKSWVRRALLALKSCLDRAVLREQAGGGEAAAAGVVGAGAAASAVRAAPARRG